MTNFEKNFDSDTKIRVEELGKDGKGNAPAKSVSGDGAQRDISLTLFGEIADLCSYADTAIAEGFVQEVHVTSEDGKPVMKMEYDEAVSAFLADLAGRPSSKDCPLEFKLSAK